VLYDFVTEPPWAFGALLLEFDYGVKGVWVKLWTNKQGHLECGDPTALNSHIELFELEGPFKGEIPSIFFHPCPSQEYLLFVHLNGTYRGFPEYTRVFISVYEGSEPVPDGDGRLGVYIKPSFLEVLRGEELATLEVYVQVVGVCP